MTNYLTPSPTGDIVVPIDVLSVADSVYHIQPHPSGAIILVPIGKMEQFPQLEYAPPGKARMYTQSTPEDMPFIGNPTRFSEVGLSSQQDIPDPDNGPGVEASWAEPTPPFDAWSPKPHPGIIVDPNPQKHIKAATSVGDICMGCVTPEGSYLLWSQTGHPAFEAAPPVATDWAGHTPEPEPEPTQPDQAGVEHLTMLYNLGEVLEIALDTLRKHVAKYPNVRAE